MNLKVGCFMAVLLLAGCAKQPPSSQTNRGWLKKTPPGGSVNVPKSSTGSNAVAYSDVIKQAATHYGVDETLIKAIIQVESGYNPDVVSASNAIGLMQIKASTAGRDAYRMKGRNGQPSSGELKDPVKNIDIGAAYINILQNQQLAGISDPQTLHYATIVSYANGAGAMLRTFSSDKRLAVNKINSLSPNEFYQHIQKKHPAAQAPRYLWKVDTAYRAMSE
ncbi:MAG: membrane-bound lytic murein transglycosylase EmtA [Yersinia sp. (in: enterobacteria)]